MHVDLQSLGTFNRLAHEGAEQASQSLARMTGINATVEVTAISLLQEADLAREVDLESVVGVQFDYEGALDGRTVLVFDSECVGPITRRMLPEGMEPADMEQSCLEEVGNVMMSGFIDGWADYLSASIDHGPPTYVDAEERSVLLESAPTGEDDHVLLFKSEIQWVEESLEFLLYMLPDYESIADLMADHVAETGESLPVDKLAVFNRMTTEGARKAADNVEAMTGIETTADVTSLTFTPIEDVPKQVGVDPVVGTVVEFTGVPSGFLVVLFDEVSALTVSDALLPAGSEGGDVGDREKMAIQELGNIMTSGFLDGWGNVLQTGIDHTPPRVVHDIGRSIVDPLAAQLGRDQRYALFVDSTMVTDDVSFTCDVLALPDEAELRRALSELDVDRAHRTEVDPSTVFE